MYCIVLTGNTRREARKKKRERELSLLVWSEHINIFAAKLRNSFHPQEEY
jgi:hypothetical protein|tara:strand:- start:47 stop:196 length:150 start_codon:yes stop_codon:yes gene_type:complete